MRFYVLNGVLKSASVLVMLSSLSYYLYTITVLTKVRVNLYKIGKDFVRFSSNRTEVL